MHWQKLRHLKTQLYLRIKWRNVKTNWKTNNQKIRIQNWFPLIELYHQLDTTDTHHVCQIIGVTIFTDILKIIEEENCHSKEKGKEDNEHHTQPTVEPTGGGHLKSEWNMLNVMGWLRGPDVNVLYQKEIIWAGNVIGNAWRMFYFATHSTLMWRFIFKTLTL